MDIQLKKGLYDYLVLSSVSLEPSYGYKIIQDLSNLSDITESTLYPILRRLEQQSLLTVFTREHNSRLRKYYFITQDGRRRISEFAVDWIQVQAIANYILRRI